MLVFSEAWPAMPGTQGAHRRERIDRGGKSRAVKSRMGAASEYWGVQAMDYNKDKVDDYTLALMFLVLHGDGFGARAWKGFDWDTLGRLHEKGFLADPKGKARSVVVTEEGGKRSEELFHRFFVGEEGADNCNA